MDARENKLFEHEVMTRKEEIQKAFCLFDAKNTYIQNVLMIGGAAEYVADKITYLSEQRLNNFYLGLGSLFHKKEMARRNYGKTVKEVNRLVDHTRCLLAYKRPPSPQILGKISQARTRHCNLFYDWQPTIKGIDMLYEGERSFRGLENYLSWSAHIFQMSSARRTKERQEFTQKTGTTPEDFFSFMKSVVDSKAEYYRHREIFMVQNQKFILTVASDFNLNGTLEKEDLISAGERGLMKAIEKFDPRKGFKFSTYAVNWIRQTIRRELQDNARNIRLPVHAGDSLYHMRKYIQHWQETTGSDEMPDIDEISDATKTSPKIVKSLMNYLQGPTSLDDEIDTRDGSKTSRHNLIEDPNAKIPYNEVDNTLMIKTLYQALEELDPRERIILEKRFGLNGSEEMTFEEIRPVFKVSRERIRQIEAMALRKLRNGKYRDILNPAF